MSSTTRSTDLPREYGDRDVALEIADNDHDLLRFYLPPDARWAVISGRAQYDWPDDERGRSTRPRDIGEHLTKAVRAVVRFNPSLAGVIDVVDFAAERNGERDINPAKLNGVVETFSDPRYRLGLADVQPDFLGRAYEYLLRKFAEGSGQSAGEFFTRPRSDSLSRASCGRSRDRSAMTTHADLPVCSSSCSSSRMNSTRPRRCRSSFPVRSSKLRASPLRR